MKYNQATATIGTAQIYEKKKPLKTQSEPRQSETKLAPRHWSDSCANSECTLHQLSPYIGKLKSSIASDLISRYTKNGNLIVDPFCGAGTIPLEAIRLGRRIFASDVSQYATVLTCAKLAAPINLQSAILNFDCAYSESLLLPEPDLRQVPIWVRRFFHPRTLKSAIRLATVCRKKRDHFTLACLLGILHHQRPGFLSYPSSHLVPYLRNVRFPREQHPDLYEYREIVPRMHAKITRAYKRMKLPRQIPKWTIRRSEIRALAFPQSFDCIVSSPPYMNALDYVRDNRLRLWFLTQDAETVTDNSMTRNEDDFRKAIQKLAACAERGLVSNGHCVLIVGETVTRRGTLHPSDITLAIFAQFAPSLTLQHSFLDNIPDIRRSRKDCAGTRQERILVLKKK